MGSILNFSLLFFLKRYFRTVFRFKGHLQNEVIPIMEMFDRFSKQALILFQLFAPNFQHCLGLADVLSANQDAEIFACMLLFIYLWV